MNFYDRLLFSCLLIGEQSTHGQVFLFMESGNVLLSQVFPHALDPPPAAHMGEPNQVHSLTSSKTTGE